MYRLLVDPNEHPTLFTREPTPLISPPEEHRSVAKIAEVLPEEYSQDVLEQLDILSGSSTSNRDRRVSEILRACLAKGTLLRSDYEARGYTDNMWLTDTTLATELGLITKQPDGGYTINRELQTEFSNLKPHQKKAITAIYEAFGYDAFSSEMFVATSINVNVLILAARCAVTKNNVFQFVLGIKSAQIDGGVFRKMDFFKDNILDLSGRIVS